MFPVIEKCPICGAGAKLVRHGFYPRYALFKNRFYRLDICRYLCRSCLKTISLLPWFLLPYFQHTRNTILMALRSWLSGRPAFVCRQLVAFYRQRFYQNIPAIITALRETGWLDPLPDDDKEKAIKVVDRLMITITPTSRYSNRILTNFNGKFILPLKHPLWARPICPQTFCVAVLRLLTLQSFYRG